jgi:hypothetical protein
VPRYRIYQTESVTYSWEVEADSMEEALAVPEDKVDPATRRSSSQVDTPSVYAVKEF